MAHYARVDSNNIVIQVTTISNDIITDENGIENDEKALEHLYSTITDSIGDRWIKTSYNNNFRKRYAGIGFIWNEEMDVFIPPKPFNSWVLNLETFDWESPIPMPENVEDGPYYVWDEEIVNWKPVY